jgi:hypothetical protein
MTQHEAWVFIANDAIAGVRWFGISYVFYTNDSMLQRNVLRR